MEDHRTMLWDGAAPEVVVPVGARGLAERQFRHDRSAPYEIEQAIDRVEDVLAATGLKHAVCGDLLTRDEEELRFQRLASVALAHPGSGDRQPAGTAAAALQILRECMHHLGYAGVRRKDG